MHPRTKELLDHLETQRTELRRAVDSVPEELRQRRPADGGWTVAQVIEHLAIVDGRIAGRVRKGVQEAGASLGNDAETSSLIAAYNAAQALDRGTQAAAPEATIPHDDVDFAAAWDALRQSTEKLNAAIQAADGLALGTVMAPHARFGQYSLYDWILFAGFHEARHAEQIREIGVELGKS